MAPLLEKDDGSMLGEGTGSDALTMVISVGLVALAAVASLVLIIFGCGCGGGKAEAEVTKEGKAEEKKEPAPPAAPEVKSARMEKSGADSGGSALKKSMKHVIPLAPPGHTVPPVMIPDDDDKTVQTPMKGSSKK